MAAVDVLAKTIPATQAGAAAVLPPTSAPLRDVVLKPLAPDRYKVQLTVTGATHDKLRRAQHLLRHAIPSGNLAEIVDRAVTLLLADLERTKLAAVGTPRPARSRVSGSRYIPAAVRRAVWTRDGGRCAFVGAEGRCAERGFLEFHHVKPHGVGGTASVGTWNCGAAPTISTRPSISSAADYRCSGKGEPTMSAPFLRHPSLGRRFSWVVACPPVLGDSGELESGLLDPTALHVTHPAFRTRPLRRIKPRGADAPLEYQGTATPRCRARARR